MKSNIATFGFLLLFLLVYMFCSNSCSEQMVSDPFEYTEKAFDAELFGKIDGEEMGAVLQSRPNAAGEEIKVCARFIAPRGLSSITVSLTGDGITEARIGDLKIENDHLKGLLKPFESFYEHASVSSLYRGGNKKLYVTVCDENCDLEYVFAAESPYPEQIKGVYYGRKIEFSVKIFKFADEYG